MALFINGVGQDTFNMNGVSIDNLYVDGVLVWSSYVNTKPIITIIGDNPMYLVLNGSAYVEQGATANDLEDGDITNDIVIGGDTPDVSVEGYYYVTYNVTDSEGLAADERVRTVSVYAVTVPKYELTEALINDGTFDYVPDSNNPESAFEGKLTESDGTTPYEPTELQYPRKGLLELDNGRIINTQFDIDSLIDGYGIYGIYDADGSTTYKIWAIYVTGSGLGQLYEGDQDTPLALYGYVDVNGIPNPYTVTDGRPSWMPEIDTRYTAIPGLYSFGTDTRAAYGGAVDPVVLHVDTLVAGISNTDSTHGSFEWCVTQTYPRIVVFDVGGVIDADENDKITIESPYLTIAGQTAPSMITYNGNGIRINTSDVLMSHIGVRNKNSLTSNDGDAIEVTSDTQSISNVIIDHCSASFAIDEQISVADYGNGLTDITISNCIIAKGTPDANDPYGSLNYGTNIAHIGNLYAHNYMRSPQFGFDGRDGTISIFNNVMYNWQHTVFLMVTDCDKTVSFVGNHAIEGLDTYSEPNLSNSLVTINTGSIGANIIHMSDNIKHSDVAVSGYDVWDRPALGYTQLPSAVDTNGYVIAAASETRANVLANVGAFCGSRDTLDTEIINDVINGTGNIATTFQTMPAEASTSSEFIAVANPHDMYDANYTNLEKQLHDLADIVEAPAEPPVYGPELIQGGGNDNGIVDGAEWTPIPANDQVCGRHTIGVIQYINSNTSVADGGHYQSFATEIGETYEVNIDVIGGSVYNQDPTGASSTYMCITDTIPITGVQGTLVIDTNSTSPVSDTIDYVATSTTTYITLQTDSVWNGGNASKVSVKKRT